MHASAGQEKGEARTGVVVSLTGRVSITANETVVHDERFPGRQGRLVFACLATQAGRPIPRDELAAALWGDVLPATWEKALTVIVSKLRALLEECGIDGAKALTSAFGCYRLDLPDDSDVDVVEARRAVEDDAASVAEIARAAAIAGSRSCRETKGSGSRRNGESSQASERGRWSAWSMQAWRRVTTPRR